MSHPGNIIEAVTRFITGRPKSKGDGLKQTQREAFIDAMLYCLLADDYDDPAEQKIMDKSIARMNWESSISIEDYIAAAKGRIEQAVASPGTERTFLEGVSQRLEDTEARFQVLQMCKILLYSDLFIPDEEARALAELSRCLKRHK